MPGQTLEQTQACLQSCRQVKDITSKDVVGIDNLYWDTVLKVSKWIIIAETIASRWSGNEPMMSGLGRAAEIEPDSSYLKL